MTRFITYKKFGFFKRLVSGLLLVIFLTTTILPPQFVYAQALPQLSIQPSPIAPLSVSFQPPLLTGITLHPENPLQFDFIIDTGDDHLAGESLQNEGKKLIKYFMAALTVPENEMWVNLSPYEKDRIIANGLRQTEMGRDLLVQDYLLKQMTSSLMNPENELGEKLWAGIYEKLRAKFGTSNIPVDTFHKIWIVPEKASVYVQGKSVYVMESKLKVLLEDDYLALAHHSGETAPAQNKNNELTTGMIRELLLPEIEKEVNEGKDFAPLRQMYNSMILATWYKQNLKESLLGKVYVDQNKTRGVDLKDKNVQQKIYEEYLQAFKKGAYDYIKEDYDPATQQVISRKYFSGGADFAMLSKVNAVKKEPITEWLNNQRSREKVTVTAGFEPIGQGISDQAMLAQETITDLASNIHREFKKSFVEFNGLAKDARDSFRAKTWNKSHELAKRRRYVMREATTRAVNFINSRLGNVPEQAVWKRLRIEYEQLVKNNYDKDLSVMFFYSVMREMLFSYGQTVEFDDETIMEQPQEKGQASLNVTRKYVKDANTTIEQLIKKILEDYRINGSLSDVDAQAQEIAGRIEQEISKNFPRETFYSIELLIPAFFRNQEAYVIGNIRVGEERIPFALTLHNEEGVKVNTVLIGQENVWAILFASTRASLIVNVERYRDMVSFLKQTFPQKPRSLIYSSLGLINPAKVELIQGLRKELQIPGKKFVRPQGAKGSVMVAFTLPGEYRYNFKVISDRSVKEGFAERGGRQYVMDAFRFIHDIDRIGRMLDSPHLLNMRFKKSDFEESILRDLLERAPSSVVDLGDDILITDIFAQRQVTPVSVFLKQDHPMSEKIRVLLDYGQAIKDIAGLGIFPGDYTLNNFGITESGRVVWFDYDEIDYLSEKKFKKVPAPRNEFEEMNEPSEWLVILPNDIYPENDFHTLLRGLSRELVDAFEEKHGDLKSVEFWKSMQDKVQQKDEAMLVRRDLEKIIKGVLPLDDLQQQKLKRDAQKILNPDNLKGMLLLPEVENMAMEFIPEKVRQSERGYILPIAAFVVLLEKYGYDEAAERVHTEIVKRIDKKGIVSNWDAFKRQLMEMLKAAGGLLEIMPSSSSGKLSKPLSAEGSMAQAWNSVGETMTKVMQDLDRLFEEYDLDPIKRSDLKNKLHTIIKEAINPLKLGYFRVTKDLLLFFARDVRNKPVYHTQSVFQATSFLIKRGLGRDLTFDEVRALMKVLDKPLEPFQKSDHAMLAEDKEDAALAQRESMITADGWLITELNSEEAARALKRFLDKEQLNPNAVSLAMGQGKMVVTKFLGRLFEQKEAPLLVSQKKKIFKIVDIVAKLQSRRLSSTQMKAEIEKLLDDNYLSARAVSRELSEDEHSQLVTKFLMRLEEQGDALLTMRQMEEANRIKEKIDTMTLGVITRGEMAKRIKDVLARNNVSQRSVSLALRFNEASVTVFLSRLEDRKNEPMTDDLLRTAKKILKKAQKRESIQIQQFMEAMQKYLFRNPKAKNIALRIWHNEDHSDTLGLIDALPPETLSDRIVATVVKNRLRTIANNFGNGLSTRVEKIDQKFKLNLWDENERLIEEDASAVDKAMLGAGETLVERESMITAEAWLLTELNSSDAALALNKFFGKEQLNPNAVSLAMGQGKMAVTKFIRRLSARKEAPLLDSQKDKIRAIIETVSQIQSSRISSIQMKQEIEQLLGDNYLGARPVSRKITGNENSQMVKLFLSHLGKQGDALLTMRQMKKAEMIKETIYAMSALTRGMMVKRIRDALISNGLTARSVSLSLGKDKDFVKLFLSRLSRGRNKPMDEELLKTAERILKKVKTKRIQVQEFVGAMYAQLPRNPKANNIALRIWLNEDYKETLALIDFLPQQAMQNRTIATIIKERVRTIGNDLGNGLSARAEEIDRKFKLNIWDEDKELIEEDGLATDRAMLAEYSYNVEVERTGKQTLDDFTYLKINGERRFYKNDSNQIYDLKKDPTQQTPLSDPEADFIKYFARMVEPLKPVSISAGKYARPSSLDVSLRYYKDYVLISINADKFIKISRTNPVYIIDSAFPDMHTSKAKQNFKAAIMNVGLMALFLEGKIPLSSGKKFQEIRQEAFQAVADQSMLAERKEKTISILVNLNRQLGGPDNPYWDGPDFENKIRAEVGGLTFSAEVNQLIHDYSDGLEFINESNIRQSEYNRNHRRYVEQAIIDLDHLMSFAKEEVWSINDFGAAKDGAMLAEYSYALETEQTGHQTQYDFTYIKINGERRFYKDTYNRIYDLKNDPAQTKPLSAYTAGFLRHFISNVPTLKMVEMSPGEYFFPNHALHVSVQYHEDYVMISINADKFVKVSRTNAQEVLDSFFPQIPLGESDYNFKGVILNAGLMALFFADKIKLDSSKNFLEVRNKAFQELPDHAMLIELDDKEMIESFDRNGYKQVKALRFNSRQLDKDRVLKILKAIDLLDYDKGEAEFVYVLSGEQMKKIPIIYKTLNEGMFGHGIFIHESLINDLEKIRETSVVKMDTQHLEAFLGEEVRIREILAPQRGDKAMLVLGNATENMDAVRTVLGYLKGRLPFKDAVGQFAVEAFLLGSPLEESLKTVSTQSPRTEAWLKQSEDGIPIRDKLDHLVNTFFAAWFTVNWQDSEFPITSNALFDALVQYLDKKYKSEDTELEYSRLKIAMAAIGIEDKSINQAIESMDISIEHQKDNLNYSDFERLVLNRANDRAMIAEEPGQRQITYHFINGQEVTMTEIGPGWLDLESPSSLKEEKYQLAVSLAEQRSRLLFFKDDPSYHDLLQDKADAGEIFYDDSASGYWVKLSSKKFKPAVSVDEIFATMKEELAALRFSGEVKSGEAPVYIASEDLNEPDRHIVLGPHGKRYLHLHFYNEKGGLNGLLLEMKFSGEGKIIGLANPMIESRKYSRTYLTVDKLVENRIISRERVNFIFNKVLEYVLQSEHKEVWEKMALDPQAKPEYGLAKSVGSESVDGLFFHTLKIDWRSGGIKRDGFSVTSKEGYVLYASLGYSFTFVDGVAEEIHNLMGVKVGKLTLKSATIRDLIDLQAEKYGSRRAIVVPTADGKYKEISFAGFRDRVRKVTEALYVKGIRQGDKVAFMAPNSLAFVETAMGVWKLGGVVVPLNPTETDERKEYMIQNSEAKFLLVPATLQAQAEAIKEKNPQLTVIVLDTLLDKQLLVASWLLEQHINITPDDLALILYTSGTSGFPKGVLLTHKNILYNREAVAQAWQGKLTDEDVTLGGLPFFHVMGLTFEFLGNFYTGMTYAFPRLNGQTTPDQLLKALEATKANVFYAVPKTLQGMAMIAAKNSEALATLQNLKFIMSGGAKLDFKTGEFLTQHGVNVIQGYGMTEVGGAILLGDPSARDWQKLHALPGIAVNFDEAQGSNGRVLVVNNSPTVMQGYLKNQEATAAVLTKGKFYTKDIFKVEGDGVIYADRVGDGEKLPNGEYFQPNPYQMEVERSPLINKTMVSSRWTGALIAVVEPNYSELAGLSSEKVEEAIWREFERVNELQFRSSKVRRENILILGKDEQPIPTSRKGDVLRPAALEQFSARVKAKFEGPDRAMLSEKEIAALTPEFNSAKEFFNQIKQWEISHPDDKTLVFVRHGESMSNLLRYQQDYSTFTPLTTLGQRQAANMAKFFRDRRISFGRYISSDSERAYETLAETARDNGKTPEIFHRFREVLIDPATGEKEAAEDKNYADLFDQFLDDPLNFITPAYSGRKFKRYAQEMFGEIAQSELRHTIIVTHGMTMILSAMELLGLDYQKYRAVFEKMGGTTPNLGMVAFAYNPQEQRWRLLFNPDDTYLAEESRGRTTDPIVKESEYRRFLQIAQERLAQPEENAPQAPVISDWYPRRITFFNSKNEQLQPTIAEYQRLIKDSAMLGFQGEFAKIKDLCKQLLEGLNQEESGRPPLDSLQNSSARALINMRSQDLAQLRNLLRSIRNLYSEYFTDYMNKESTVLLEAEYLHQNFTPKMIGYIEEIESLMEKYKTTTAKRAAEPDIVASLEDFHAQLKELLRSAYSHWHEITKQAGQVGNVRTKIAGYPVFIDLKGEQLVVEVKTGADHFEMLSQSVLSNFRRDVNISHLIHQINELLFKKYKELSFRGVLSHQGGLEDNIPHFAKAAQEVMAELVKQVPQSSGSVYQDKAMLGHIQAKVDDLIAVWKEGLAEDRIPSDIKMERFDQWFYIFEHWQGDDVVNPLNSIRTISAVLSRDDNFAVAVVDLLTAMQKMAEGQGISFRDVVNQIKPYFKEQYKTLGIEGLYLFEELLQKDRDLHLSRVKKTTLKITYQPVDSETDIIKRGVVDSWQINKKDKTITIKFHNGQLLVLATQNQINTKLINGYYKNIESILNFSIFDTIDDVMRTWKQYDGLQHSPADIMDALDQIKRVEISQLYNIKDRENERFHHLFLGKLVRLTETMKNLVSEEGKDWDEVLGEVERVLMQRHTEETRKDQAMIGVEKPGGIDFNPEHMELKTQGQKMDLPIPVPAVFENMQIEGFIPVIINISPVTTLPILLNINIDEEKKEHFTKEEKGKELPRDTLSLREEELYWAGFC